jgi:FtsH-binding integral membrane protein
MSGFEYAPQTAHQAPSMALDAGLRSYMLGIYNKMSLGLALSAAIAWAVGSVPALSSMVFGTPLRYVVMFGPLALLLVAAFAMRRPSPLAANLLYWSVATLIGASLGAWVLAANLGAGAGFLTIAKAFFITAGAFGALSLWGYTTRRDLSAMGTVLVMGVVGLVLASLANLFFQSSLLGFIISLVGVAVFSALTAFDTQRLKQEYYVLEAGSREMAAATSLGALSLYLNFVNLFQFILSILSPRQE